MPEIWELTGPRGERTGGVFQVLNSLVFLIQMFKAFPLIVFDQGVSPRRLQIHPDYKYLQSGRPGTRAGTGSAFDEQKAQMEENYRAEYVRQRGVLMNALSLLGVPCFLIEQVEGDDIMAWLTKLPTCNLLVSEDKDLYQIVDRADVYRPIKHEYITQHPIAPELTAQLPPMDKGYTSLSEMGFDSTLHFVVSKAIIGDASDNIPGVKGIGEKSAPEIARAYLAGPAPYLAKVRDYLAAEKAAEAEKDRVNAEIDAYNAALTEGQKEKKYVRAKIDPSLPKPSAYEKKFVAGYDDFKKSLALIDINQEHLSQRDLDTIQGELRASLHRPIQFDAFIGTMAEMGMGTLIGKFGAIGQDLANLRQNALTHSGLV